MHVLVTASAHFGFTNDGQLWTPNASLGYGFWTRYLDVYDEVRLLVRAAPQAVPPDGWICATGAGIVARPLRDIESPTEYLLAYGGLRRSITRVLQETDAVLLRVPCFIGDIVERCLPPGRPYGVEVIADPYDVFAHGSVEHPFRAFFRWWFPRQLRRQCATAVAAAYVTAFALQRRYPPRPDGLATSYSDVEVSGSAFVEQPRCFEPAASRCRLIMVGTLAQLYKAPDVLLEAVAACVRDGLDLTLVYVGDGKYRSELEARAVSLGLADRVCFRGLLSSRDDVRDALDAADLFVLPSYQEGLPRAMIEAMARALPCLGSTAGGIPELLPCEDLVAPGDAVALARKIREVVRDPARMARMSERNLAVARTYDADALHQRRLAFYRAVRDATQAWLQQRVVLPV